MFFFVCSPQIYPHFRKCVIPLCNMHFLSLEITTSRFTVARSSHSLTKRKFVYSLAWGIRRLPSLRSWHLDKNSSDATQKEQVSTEMIGGTQQCHNSEVWLYLTSTIIMWTLCIIPILQVKQWSAKVEYFPQCLKEGSNYTQWCTFYTLMELHLSFITILWKRKAQLFKCCHEVPLAVRTKYVQLSKTSGMRQLTKWRQPSK